MPIENILPALVSLSLLTIGLTILLKFLKQPYVVGYIIVGFLLGPSVFRLITNQSLISTFGEIGVVFLMFFIGMEVSLSKLLSNWRVAIVGTFFQVIFSVLFVVLISGLFGWTLEKSVLLGFVISLSSTAVVLKMLDEWKELGTRIGQNVIGILLVQDFAVIPMLIVLSLMHGNSPGIGHLGIQILAGGAIIALFALLISKRSFKLPFGDFVKNDHDLQVFAALMICFSLALFTNLVGLSTALGAFIAGIIVSAARETTWVRSSLDSFRVIFVALFFVSIGMLINLEFILHHPFMITLLVAGIFLTNTFINAFILRFLKNSWTESLYSGALLAQVGEFSFLLATIGLQTSIISNFDYMIIISMISLSLLFSPLWTIWMKRMTIRELKPWTR